jgi:hypothetical protein
MSAIRRLPAVAVVAVVIPGASPAMADREPIVVDPVPPVAVAAHGDALAWLRPRDRGVSELVVRDAAGAAPRVAAPRLPKRARQLTLGTDARGRLTAVFTAGGPRRSALYSVKISGSGRVRRLPVDTRAWEYAPGLRGGRLSFIRRGRGDLDGYGSTRLMLGRLDRARARVIHALGLHYLASERQTAVADGGTVLLTQTDPNVRAAGVTVDRLVAYRRGRRPRVLVRHRVRTGDGRFDNHGASGLGPLVLDAGGERATVARWAVHTSQTDLPVRGRRDLITAEVAGGRRSSQPPPGGYDIALPLTDGSFAVYDAGHDDYASDTAPARDETGALRIIPAPSR